MSRANDSSTQPALFGSRWMARLRVRVPCVAEPELMDLPGQDPRLLAGNFADLQRVNRWLRGAALTMRGLQRLGLGESPDTTVTILDVATGAADIPRSIVRWMRSQGVGATLVAVDVRRDILSVAGTEPQDDVLLAGADGRSLPFRDDAFDAAICSMVLHHLDPDDAAAMLREMARVARRGVVVNDLVRTRRGYLGAIILAHLLSQNPLTRHDAPLSVRRAYTHAEMSELARRAGLVPIAYHSFAGYRTALTAVRSE